MISLKAYHREIDILIDNGQYDEAIAHCIHILSIYPKCIDSYRCLGKSLLELKKYPEAQDVFFRVLSAIPDDFISHVGLSIIFEGQSNLDLAIWHMEQAFDIQPSNLAIQNELRRLFGLRDGEQPSKIRLTRGALVRMYARGELFQQAITEILTILEEDPRRIDLEVILAQMNYFSGTLNETELVCNRILEKIPFCYEANRIMQQIRINKNDNDGATINKNRLENLDPYYQFVPSPFSIQEIPEDKVLLEKLQYLPSTQSDTQIPEWLEDIDLSTQGQVDEPFKWLGNLSKSDNFLINSVVKPFSQNDQTSDTYSENSFFPVDEVKPTRLNSSELKSNPESIPIEDEKKLNFQKFESNELITEENLVEPLKENNIKITPKVTNEDLASLFTELKEGKMDNTIPNTNANDEYHPSSSDWKSQFSNTDKVESSDSSEQDFPDWLKNIQAEEPQINQDSDDMPDWLKNLQSEIEPNFQSSTDIQLENSSNINNEETTIEAVFSDKEMEGEKTNVDDLLSKVEEQDDWEKIDLTKEASLQPVETVYKNPDVNHISSDDKIPDWVKSVLINQNPDEQSTLPQDSKILSSQNDDSTSDDSTNSSTSSHESEAEAEESGEGIISQQTNDELLDWLRGLKTEDEPVKQEEVTSSNEINFETNLEEEIINKLYKSDAVEESINSHVDKSTPLDNETLDHPEEETVLANTSPLFVSEPMENQSVINESVVSDFKNQEAVSSDGSDIEPIENIQPIDEVQDKFRTSSKEYLLELVHNSDFHNISKEIFQNDVQGQELDQLLLTLNAAANDHVNNFTFWQCLGDIQSKKNQLHDALLSYQKAEDILIKKIS